MAAFRFVGLARYGLALARTQGTMMTDNSAMPDVALYESGRKSLGVAYLLWFFLGLFGAHRFYTRAGRTGWWLLLLHVGGWVLLAIAWHAAARTTTVSYEDAFGMGTTTEIVSGGSGGPLAAIGRLMRGIAWVWWLVDIVLVPGLVRSWNNRLAAGLGMKGF